VYQTKGFGSGGGGFRVITYLIDEKENGFEINLMIIYVKYEESSIKKSEIIKII
jgi:hypothetical protein